jgi:hypothetical protein
LYSPINQTVESLGWQTYLLLGVLGLALMVRILLVVALLSGIAVAVTLLLTLLALLALLAVVTLRRHTVGVCGGCVEID